jgi:hypothetical protein
MRVGSGMLCNVLGFPKLRSFLAGAFVWRFSEGLLLFACI